MVFLMIFSIKKELAMYHATRKVPMFNISSLKHDPKSTYFSLYRGIIIHWSDYAETRLLDFIDDMPQSDREQLITTSYHKGGIWFTWRGNVPAAYKQGEAVMTRDNNDQWSVMESIGMGFIGEQ